MKLWTGFIATVRSDNGTDNSKSSKCEWKGNRTVVIRNAALTCHSDYFLCRIYTLATWNASVWTRCKLTIAELRSESTNVLLPFLSHLRDWLVSVLLSDWMVAVECSFWMRLCNQDNQKIFHFFLTCVLNLGFLFEIS